MKIRRLIIIAGLVLTPPALAQDTRNFTDDLGRTVEIPVNPERIASLHDVGLTIPLLELGIMPVGSHGRTTGDCIPLIRSSKVLTGIDFDTSDIAFLGNLPADNEAVASVAPDLIVTTPWQQLAIVQLEQIAPTIVLDNSIRPAYQIYDVLAEVTGTQDHLTTC